MTDAIRRQRVVLQTDRHRIVGEVILPAEGVRTRLSDLLNREGISFIAVVDAEVSEHEGGRTTHHDFIAVARQHVQIAYESPE
jgi:hypothetical protein